MRKLVIWTSAKVETLDSVVGPTLHRLGVPNVCISYKEPKTVGFEGDKPIQKHRVPKIPKGFVCLGMGTKCIESLKKESIVPKNLGTGKLRETVFDAPNGGTFMASYDPGIVFIDYARKPEIEWDLCLATRFLQTGKLEPKLGNYKYVDDFSKVIEYIKRQYKNTGKSVRVACDLETVGLDSVNPDAYIVSIGFTPKEGHGFVRYFNNKGEYPDKRKGNMVLWGQIEWLLTSPLVRICGANFKFDWHWIHRHWGIHCTNFTFDSTLVGSLCDENRSNSLNMHTKIMVPALGGYDEALNRNYDKGKMHEVPKGDLLPYAAGDLDAGLRVANKLEEGLRQDPKLARFYKYLLHPAAVAFCATERRGMLVDIDEYEHLRKDVAAEIKKNHDCAMGLIPAQIRNKYLDNLSLTRPVILREFLFTKRGLNLRPKMVTEKDCTPSTAKQHLQMFEQHPKAGPFVQALFEWKSASKTMTTYIVGFLKHLRADGRFHPSYMLHKGSYGDDDGESGTNTGRTSAKSPSVQTIPKHTKWAKRLRGVYPAPKDHVVLNVDFQQGELRIAACIANEERMIAAYRKGIDLHLMTGLKLWNIQHPKQQYTLKDAIRLKKEGDVRVKSIRQAGKSANFGLLYGMQAAGFVSYAEAVYNVSLVIQEAEAFRSVFFESYPGLVHWHNNSVKSVKRHGYVRSPLGRIRHLPLIRSNDWVIRSKAERQAINSPVQSTLSDLGLLSAAILWEKYPKLWFMGFCHDALTFYLRLSEAYKWAKIIKHEMENLPLHKFGWSPQLNFPVDLEIGPNLGDMTEVQLEDIPTYLEKAA